MSDKTFIDTNVLVYAHNAEAGVKFQVASSIVDRLWDEDAGAVSVQVLEEFYVNVTRKIRSRLTKAEARSVIRQYAQWCVPLSFAEIDEAFRIEDESGISFWDALIVASAVKCGASRILSEDMNAGQRISGVVIENPFRPSKSD
jgi:predicted nucleic acid-binding protein